MKKVIAAVVAASILVFSAGATAATASQAPGLKTVKVTLRKDVKRALKRVRKLDLSRVQTKGFKLKRVRALVAGKASAKAKVRSVRAPASVAQATGRTVAKGSRAFARRGKASIRLKASKSGKRLMAQASRITLNVKVVFKTSSGERVGARYKVTLKRKGKGQGNGGSGGQPPHGSPGNPAPPVPSGPIPANAQLQFFQTFDSGWAGLSPQCSGTVSSGSDAGDGYAHLHVPADAVATAGLERCELSFGGYDHAAEPGEYWYRSRMRLGPSFPFAWGADNFVTLQQWQEDRPAGGGSAVNPVDGALFVNSAPGERMYIRGEGLPISQSGPFDINAWHDFIVHGVWTDQPTGYLEWWIDGTYVGKTTGVTSQTAGRHFWKGGITRSDDINIDQSADISNFEFWKIP